MIASSTEQITSLEGFKPDPTVRVDPPGSNPFVPSTSISVTGVPGEFQISVAESAPLEPGLAHAEKLLESMIARASRDAERYPRSARARLNLGIALLNGRRQDEAAAEFRVALSLDPRNYAAALNLARISVLRERYEEAIQLYESLESAEQGGPALLMGLASVAMRYGRLSEAEDLLQRAVRLDEESGFPRYHLGVALLARGKYRQAIAELKVAARSEVRSAAVHHALGMAYAAAGNLRKAVGPLKIALSLSPGMVEAAHALAQLYLASADAEKALEVLSELVRRQGQADVGTCELMARAYEALHKYGDARAQLLSALKLITGEGTAPLRQKSLIMNNVGYMFAQERMIDRASDWISRGLKVCPTADPILYLNLAKLDLQQKRTSSALEVLAHAREVFPGNREAIELTAVCLQRLRRVDEAIEELEGLIRSGNAGAESYALLGFFLIDEKRDVDSGIGVLEVGYGKFGDSWKLANNLAYGHLLKGDSAAARRVLEVTVVSGPIGNRVALTATWGLLRLWEGAKEEGIAFYRQAEKLATESGDTELARAVRQKLHLELARWYVRVGDREEARSEILKGLRVRGGRETYREDLESLKDLLPS